MLFVLDTVSGAEAKSVPFTTRMHLPFAQQFDKHKLNASRAIRDKDYLTCAQCLVTCIGLLSKVYDDMENNVILLSRKSIFGEESSNICVMSNNKQHLQIALSLEATANIYSYVAQGECVLDPVIICTIDEIEKQLQVSSTLAENCEVSNNHALTPYVHTPTDELVDTSQVADYEPECVIAALHVLMGTKMFLMWSQQVPSLNEDVSATVALDAASLQVKRHDYLIQAVASLNKCTKKLSKSMQHLSKEADSAKRMALAIIGWVICEKESDYVKGQAFYKAATPEGCATIGLSELEYGNCADVGLLYNLESQEVEHYLSCLR